MSEELKCSVSRYKGFNRDAKRLIITGLIDHMSFAINGFVLILYLNVLGHSNVVFGSLSLIMEISHVIILLGSGYLADTFGRKKTILLGLISGIMGMMFFAFFGSITAFVSASILIGASSGFTGPALSALLSEKTNQKRRKYLFSLSAIVSNIGSGAITLIGGFIPLLFINQFGFADEPAYRMIFIMVFLIKIIPIVLMTRVRTDRPRAKKATNGGKANRVHWLMLMKFALPSIFTGIGAGILIPYFPIYFKLRFGLDIGSIGILFAILSFIMAIMTFYLPRMADRKGSVATTTAFHVLSLLAMISIPFTPWLYIVIVLFFIRAALMNVPGPIMTSFMMSQLPHSFRATAQSINGFAWMFPHAIGVFIGGFLWDTGNLTLPFYISTILYIVSTLLYFGFFYPMDDAEHKPRFFWPILRHFTRK